MSSLSAPPTNHAPDGPGLPVLMARTCRAEWSRLWTVRSTWWFALATAVTVLSLGVVLGLDVQSEPESMPAGSAWRGGQITGTFGLYGLLALCVVAATSDHGTGGIIPALQATPRRLVLLVARTVVLVLFATAFGTVLVAGSSAIVYAFAPEMGLPAGPGVDVLAQIAFVYVAGMLVAVGTGLFARNTAGSLVAVLAVMLVLPLMLGALPFEWPRQLTEVLPGTGAMMLVAGEAPVPLSEATAYSTLSAWALITLIAGALRLLRSDVDY